MGKIRWRSMKYVSVKGTSLAASRVPRPQTFCSRNAIMSRLSLFRPRSLVVLAWLSTAVLVLIAASSAYGRNARPSDPFIPASVANHGASRPSGTCPPASSSTPAANRPGLAPALSPAELLCRPAANQAIVPKLFHQSWKTTQLPAKFQRWSDSCREKHPDWEWVLWTDEDNLRLVKEHFPWLLDTYLNLPGSIYRADLARNLYMYQFGGYVTWKPRH